MKSPLGIHSNNTLTSVDYLVVGHVAKDLTPAGHTIGGTVAYAGRTAQAHGLRVGVLTSFAADVDLTPLHGLTIQNVPANSTTSFENRYTSRGREQILRSVAHDLCADAVPQAWRATPIVHLGPIAAEIDFDLVRYFPDSFIGLTPQGWLRRWDEDGNVSLVGWENIQEILPYASAIVVSREDLSQDVHGDSVLAEQCKLLVVTEGANGARVFYRGEQRHFPAASVRDVDPTGAGDIFAAAFFVNLKSSHDPWQAARAANLVAANSVTRKGIAGTPTKDEIQAVQAEVRR